MLVAITLEIRTNYQKIIQTQSNKTLLGFNMRQLFRMLHSFVAYNPGQMNFLNENNIFRLWNSEANRTLCDRIPDVQDRVMFNMEMHNAGLKVFKNHRTEAINLQKPENLGKPIFTHICEVAPDVQVTYREQPKLDDLAPILEQQIMFFNESTKGS
jgi:hypothetical protein